MSSTNSLNPENAAEFWRGAWAEGKTGWKTYEKNSVIFHKNIRSLEETLTAKTKSTNTNANTDDDVQISIFRDHKGAFVPLCGDTYAVRFFADGFVGCGGANTTLKQVSDKTGVADDKEKELFTALGNGCRGAPNHHFVMGVDIAPEAIEKSMKQNFPDLSFVDLAPMLHNSPKNSGENAIVAHYFARAVCPTKYAAYTNGASPSSVPFVDVHLFVGDYFAVTEWWAKQAASASSCGGQGATIAFPYFDTVYDRASMMAMHPSLRQRYVDGIKMVIGCGPTNDLSVVRDKAKNCPRIFLELAHREEGKRDVGPPFHIDPFTVAPVLGEEDSGSTFYGSAFRIVPLNFDDPDNGNEVVRFKKFGLFLA